MEIKIKVEGLDQFTEAISLLASAIAVDKGKSDSYVNKASKKLKEEVKKDKKQEVKEETQKEEVKEETEEKSDITIEDVRAKFLEKNTKNNTPKLKAILKDHKVKKVTDLDESQFDSVLEALEAI